MGAIGFYACGLILPPFLWPLLWLPMFRMVRARPFSLSIKLSVAES
jgi:hypothetical protein